MRLPRFRIRTLMLAVAVVAFAIGLVVHGAALSRRSRYYKERAAWHEHMEERHLQFWDGPWPLVAVTARDPNLPVEEVETKTIVGWAEWHRRKKDACARIARYPWLPVEPDPHWPE